MPNIPPELALPIPANIAFQTGPLLLGNLFSYGLLGVLCMQVYIYRISFSRDQLSLKLLVWVIFSVDIIIASLSTIDGWNTFGSGWGDLSVLAPINWRTAVLPILSGLVSFCVHVFFCWRMWVLRAFYVVPVVIFMASLAQWGLACFCGIYSLELGIERISELEPFVLACLGVASFCDLLITVTMIQILFQSGSESAFKGTTSLTDKGIRLIVETGMAVCAIALLELVLFIIFPGNNIRYIPFLMLSKMDSITLLAILNSRSWTMSPPVLETLTAELWDNRPPPSDHLNTIEESLYIFNGRA
ncbi:hypothetical protein Hypma_000575 [Hypsizygus marmoreus]|uniref:DUF6534 domain-containing protein n=1 Tax=Hypsizygus marmoreus TaxID=39966 RepID=A0A369JCR7_HYPMA|nr:hypothetical protein Hypma_000575 [Hypsizygus marmoreus]